MIHRTTQLLLPILQSNTVPLAGFFSRLVSPFGRLINDVLALDPVIAQLLAFGLLLGGVFGLTALGLTIVFGVMDVVNFAHGVFMTVGIYTVWFVSLKLGVNPFLVLPLAVIVLFVIGVVTQLTVIEPILDGPLHNQLLATFGIALILRNTLQIFFKPDPRSLGLQLGKINVDGVFIPFGRLYSLAIAIVAIALVWILLYRTRIGLAIRATADNRDGSQFLGINVPQINYLTFGLGAALAGLAGAAISLFRLFDPFVGITYLMYAFVIVILGGLGSLRGALVGGLIIGLVQVFAAYYTPGTTYLVVIMAIFISVMIVKPKGIYGSETQ